MLDGALRLSADVVTWTAESERLGKVHSTVAATSTWSPAFDRIVAGELARDELARAGGIDGRGRVEPDMVAVLRMLCTPRAEFYGWVSHRKKTVGVLVAVTGTSAVMAVRDEDMVTITRADPASAAEALVARLPDVPAATGQAITVRADDVRNATAGSGFEQASPEVREISRITALDQTGGGQLYAAVRDDSGKRHRVEAPLRYADTVEGRYVNVTLSGGRVTVAPADPARLAERVHDMHVTLTGDREA